MDPIERLSSLFEKFPGIGPRQARRFVQYLLASPSSARLELSDLIKRLGAETSQCKRCYRWFVKQGGTAELCSVCGSTSRDQTLLFVVEKDADIDNVERSGFRGLYFVLGGTIPMASEDIPKHVRVRELMKRVQTDAPTTLKELILGFSATAEGDHTRLILSEKLRESGLKVSTLGRGLSTGSELEYADPDTIASAFNSRN